MHAGTSRTYVCLIVVALVVGTGCTSHERNPTDDPQKISAMKSLLQSLRRRHAVENEQLWYDVTISPTVSPGSHIQYAFDPAYGHRLVWSEDTIATSEVATLVETVKTAGRITGVEVYVYHWYRARWISALDLTRELYPAEDAALKAIVDRWLSTKPSTRPVR
jgi:hypothetical protein